MNSTASTGLAPSGRATTLESFGRLMQAMAPGGPAPGELAVELQATDVVITPFGKSGTTWLQQMAHALRTRGDMDFDDISRVVPWLETAAGLGLDLNAAQKARPRLFKSHLDADRIPAGGRYINACRDPQDALYSMYKFMEGWFIEPGSVSLDDFARGTFLAAGGPGNRGGDYWTHLRSWWIRREDSDVLFMAYEHMKDDLEGTIRKVADFIGVELDAELLAITMEHSSLPFMQRHKDRFDDKLMRELSVKASGLPANSDSSKVRSGNVGEARQQLSPEVVAELDALWQLHITAELGFENYAALIAALD
ncbi:sulfotransferase domain-containing protein [Halieaceae bacterium IMCC14734]|uniref:Sulfotransferase domain-containing protein n=1 Tax=Candidatus Litorirhabdus singularis TaxID=2518993 RepID=A0ABT3TGG2_9GAMM|nr:sulfotransferase domain-containing protein [Candidatus Litorirhabdus singularis]MCX2980492.1 sulfotransferase domain-containing protein [Candidatus Litorirhabdus singularis]